jgi:predicted nuclease with TOPRIM domain
MKDLNYEIGFSQAIKYVDKRVELLEKEIILQKEKFSDVEKQLKEEKDKSESLEKQIKFQENAVTGLNKRLKEEEDKSQSLEKQIKSQENEVNELNRRLNGLEERLNQRLDVVGFSYEVTNTYSSAPRIPVFKIGQISSNKMMICGGYNWSHEYGSAMVIAMCI